MTLAAKQSALIDDLNLVSDPHERLSILASQATSAGLPEPDKTDKNRVAGCVSRVWVMAELRNGKCVFRCDADSPMVKGLVALLCDLYSDCEPSEVETVEPDVWTRCGFDRLLSPTRLNGLRAVRTRIREEAVRLSQPASAA